VNAHRIVSNIKCWGNYLRVQNLASQHFVQY
jgi:hypothetical protein